MTKPAEPAMVQSTDGVVIALHDLGGAGPPLLLAHATGFHGLVWAPVAANLREFHCYALDFRGHGDSIAPPEVTFEWAGFAQDVLAVLDALGIDHVLAAGHSKGGAALLLAEQRRPGAFQSLYLFEPIAFPLSAAPSAGAGNPLATATRRRRAEFDSFEAAFEHFASKPPLDILAPDALRAYVDGGFAQQSDGTVRLKCLPEVEAQVYEMGPRHGAFEHLDEVKTPVTVAVGIEGSGLPESFGKAIADALPAGRLQRHHDLGHFGPMQDPAAIAEDIRVTMMHSKSTS